MMKLFWFFLVLVVLFDLSEQTSHAEQHFCGKVLAEALDMACDVGYPTMMKKSVDLDNYAYNEIEDNLPYAYANSPFLTKMHEGSANLLAKTRRRRQGIIDECCRKSCTFSELKSYCLVK